jgi:hypothetical protein
MTTNGEATATEATGPSEQQATQPTFEETLKAQAAHTGDLGVRVASLLDATRDAFEQFVMESSLLFRILSQRPGQQPTEQPNANRTTDTATAQG